MNLRKIIACSLLVSGCIDVVGLQQSPKMFCEHYIIVEFPITNKASWEVYCKVSVENPFAQRGPASVIGGIYEKKLEKSCVNSWDGSQANTIKYLNQPDLDTCRLWVPPEEFFP